MFWSVASFETARLSIRNIAKQEVFAIRAGSTSVGYCMYLFIHMDRPLGTKGIYRGVNFWPPKAIVADSSRIARTLRLIRNYSRDIE